MNAKPNPRPHLGAHLFQSGHRRSNRPPVKSPTMWERRDVPGFCEELTRAEARQEDRRPANGPASVARPSESAGCATAHRRVAGLVPREGDVSSEYQLTTPIKAIAPPSRVGTSPYHDVCQEQRQENSFNSASAIASEYYLLLAIASELLDMAMESMTEVMLGGNPSAEPCSQRPLVPEEHGGRTLCVDHRHVHAGLWAIVATWDLVA